MEIFHTVGPPLGGVSPCRGFTLFTRKKKNQPAVWWPHGTVSIQLDPFFICPALVIVGLSPSPFPLKTRPQFVLSINWVDTLDDLKKGRLLSKVHTKCLTNAPQTCLAGEMFSRCTSESPPRVLVTSASQYMFFWISFLTSLWANFPVRAWENRVTFAS